MLNMPMYALEYGNFSTLIVTILVIHVFLNPRVVFLLDNITRNAFIMYLTHFL